VYVCVWQTRVSSKGGAQWKLPPQTGQLPPQMNPTSPPRLVAKINNIITIANIK